MPKSRPAREASEVPAATVARYGAQPINVDICPTGSGCCLVALPQTPRFVAMRPEHVGGVGGSGGLLCKQTSHPRSGTGVSAQAAPQQSPILSANASYCLSSTPNVNRSYSHSHPPLLPSTHDRSAGTPRPGSGRSLRVGRLGRCHSLDSTVTNPIKLAQIAIHRLHRVVRLAGNLV